MGYAVYEDPQFPTFRWAGYGVPAECDIPNCHEKIDRGMGYRCEEYIEYVEIVDADGDYVDDEEIEKEGCGLHFCEAHSDHETHHEGVQPKPDTLEWRRWLLLAPSWAKWRDQHYVAAKEIEAQVAAASPEELSFVAEQDKDILEDTAD